MATSKDGLDPLDRHSDEADERRTKMEQPPSHGDPGSIGHSATAPGSLPGKPDANSQPGTWALAGVGVELAGGVAVFAMVGWWLDTRYSTGPWLMVLGGVLGVIGGVYNLWKQVRRYL
jgi:hypothetical protein